MDWTSLGAIGELVSAFAVVASLVYVGNQIKQNTSVARAEAHRDISLAYAVATEFWVEPSYLPTYAKMVFDGATKGDLSREERLATAGRFESILRVYEATFHQIEAGVLDDVSFESMGTLIYSWPYFHEAWPVLRSEFDDGFVRFVEGRPAFVQFSRDAWPGIGDG